MIDYKLDIRIAISKAFINIPLSELIELLENITDDLKSFNINKKILENYLNSFNKKESKC